jgi:lipopolysaccharide biosynthesis protein
VNAKIIAFYLPQFHPIPENDRWWGKGFTEWTNVAKAKPLFSDHYQPRIPADLGFYDLRLAEVRHAQALLAKEYGVHGFCYYHYWFGGRRILERPVNEILALGEPDLPFCFCWANHSWNTVWQGTDTMLIEQVYPGWDDHEAHFQYLLKAFTDRRYITVEGRPLFVIYKPDNIPEMEKVAAYWRTRAREEGLPGLHLVGVSHRSEKWDPRLCGLDACTMQVLPRRNRRIPRKYLAAKLKVWVEGNQHQLSIYDYEEVLPILLRRKKVDFIDYPLVLPNWDNTPRSGMNGLVLHDSCPSLFSKHFREALRRVESYPLEHKIIFLKAWNEWAEGNYVEPDMRFGRGYLQAIRDELRA